MKVVIVLASIFLMSSCAKNLGSSNDNEFMALDVNGEVSFENLKNNILIPKCLRCHAWVENQSDVHLRVVANDPSSSSLYTEVESGRMPKNSPELTSSEKLYIYNYIKSLDSDDTPARPTPTPGDDNDDPDPGNEKVTFKQIKESFLDTKCLSCHKVWVQDEESFLSAKFKGELLVKKGFPNKSIVYEAVKTDRMPIGLNKLTGKEKKELFRYIKRLKDSGNTPDPKPTPTPTPPNGQRVSFKRLVKKVLEPYCLICHDEWSDEDEFKATLIPGSPLLSEAYLQVESGEMPLGGEELSDKEKKLVYDYIIGLTSDGDSTPGPTPILVPPSPNPPNPDRISYETLSKEVLGPSCFTCHGQWEDDEEEFLKTIVPGKPNQSLSYSLVKNNVMPEGGPALSVEDKKLLFNYILKLNQSDLY